MSLLAFAPSSRRKIRSFIIFLLALVIGSCTSVQPPPDVTPAKSIPSLTSARKTVSHIIAPGETLWRLSQMYDVPIATIIQANHLGTNQELQMGQKVIVPNAAKIKPVITLFPSHKWRYIIIHHSATEEGSSLTFNRSHLQKGWENGVGYHFVIDNGQSGKQDGQIELTPRWLKQEDGAHCKASDMNTKAIGICLVGNFDKERPSPAQYESLVELVDKLRKYYKIPRRNIMGHGSVRESNTHCPGKHFPWGKFQEKLKDR